VDLEAGKITHYLMLSAIAAGADRPRAGPAGWDVAAGIATPAARHVLERLAAGAPESRLTRAAKSSMDRIPKE